MYRGSWNGRCFQGGQTRLCELALGLGFGVWGLGFGVWGLGFRV